MSDEKARENRLWKWLSGARKTFKLSLHMSRIENAVGSGMADVEGCLRGDQFWIELKSVARPARASTPLRPKFQPKQAPWLRRRVEAGGRAYVLVQVGSGSDARRYLIHGRLAEEVEAGRTEDWMYEASGIDPKASPEDVIRTAADWGFALLG